MIKTRKIRRGRPAKAKGAKVCKMASAYFTPAEIKKLKLLVGARQKSISAYLRDLVMPELQDSDNSKTG